MARKRKSKLEKGIERRRAEDVHSNELKGRHLSIWTSLASGDAVFIRAMEGREFLGTIESKTNDDMIIWIRDNLNERRLFHFEECTFVHVID
jgi:hypothetical protein